MLSRCGCVLGRFSPTTVRSLAFGSARVLSASAPLASNGSEATPKPVVQGREGLVGFLYEKTGVTGAWTLGVGLAATLVSKELYIINAETVVAVVMGGVIYWLVTKLGTPTAEYLDNRSQAILDRFNEGRISHSNQLQELIKHEKSVEEMLECRHEVFEILRENSEMRLEEEYRRRLHDVNREVKKRLDYQVAVEKLQKQFEQEHLVQWLERTVTDTIKAKPDENLTQCISELRQMAAS